MCLVLNTARIAETDQGGARVHDEMESDSKREKMSSSFILQGLGESDTFQMEVGKRWIINRRPVDIP